MVKTSLYLPDDLKRAIEIEAARQGASEAEVIRATLRQGLERSPRKPREALFSGNEPIAHRADELLAGFGE